MIKTAFTLRGCGRTGRGDRGGTNQPSFDLSGDGVVDVVDLTAWLSEAGEANLGPGLAYLAGDANLDGVVDVPDFNLWNSRKFSAAGGWCEIISTPTA